MPLYEYACPQCEERFEVLQRMGADASGVRCPGCGGTQVAREVSTFAAAATPAAGARSAPAGCACHPGRGSCP